MNALIPRALALLLVVLASLFVVMGLRWLVDPAGIAAELGLTLEIGLGLSSQVGDLSAFFLVAGLSGLIALVSRQRIWFYPTAMLLLFAAGGRTIAWIIHGADFAAQMILFEIVVAGLFLAGSRVLASR